MPKKTRGDTGGRNRTRAHPPSTPPRTNAVKPVRRARLSADPKIERSAWLEIEAMLVAAHKRLDQQFSRAAKLAFKDADGLALAGERIIHGLRSHFDLKTGTVYPVLYETLPDAGAILEAEIEIEVALELMGRLEQMKPFDERYQPTINILAAWIERHLEHERGRLFSAARRAQPAFARRIANVRARFAQDAAVLADAPASVTSVPSAGAAPSGRHVTPAKSVRRASARNVQRASAEAPAAGFVN